MIDPSSQMRTDTSSPGPNVTSQAASKVESTDANDQTDKTTGGNSVGGTSRRSTPVFALDLEVDSASTAAVSPAIYGVFLRKLNYRRHKTQKVPAELNRPPYSDGLLARGSSKSSAMILLNKEEEEYSGTDMWRELTEMSTTMKENRRKIHECTLLQDALTEGYDSPQPDDVNKKSLEKKKEVQSVLSDDDASSAAQMAKDSNDMDVLNEKMMNELQNILSTVSKAREEAEKISNADTPSSAEFSSEEECSSSSSSVEDPSSTEEEEDGDSSSWEESDCSSDDSGDDDSDGYVARMQRAILNVQLVHQFSKKMRRSDGGRVPKLNKKKALSTKQRTSPSPGEHSSVTINTPLSSKDGAKINHQPEAEGYQNTPIEPPCQLHQHINSDGKMVPPNKDLNILSEAARHQFSLIKPPHQQHPKSKNGGNHNLTVKASIQKPSQPSKASPPIQIMQSMRKNRKGTQHRHAKVESESLGARRKAPTKANKARSARKDEEKRHRTESSIRSIPKSHNNGGTQIEQQRPTLPRAPHRPQDAAPSKRRPPQAARRRRVPPSAASPPENEPTAASSKDESTLPTAAAEEELAVPGWGEQRDGGPAGGRCSLLVLALPEGQLHVVEMAGPASPRRTQFPFKKVCARPTKLAGKVALYHGRQYITLTDITAWNLLKEQYGLSKRAADQHQQRHLKKFAVLPKKLRSGPQRGFGTKEKLQHVVFYEQSKGLPRPGRTQSAPLDAPGTAPFFKPTWQRRTVRTTSLPQPAAGSDVDSPQLSLTGSSLPGLLRPSSSTLSRASKASNIFVAGEGGAVRPERRGMASAEVPQVSSPSMQIESGSTSEVTTGSGAGCPFFTKDSIQTDCESLSSWTTTESGRDCNDALPSISTGLGTIANEKEPGLPESPLPPPLSIFLGNLSDVRAPSPPVKRSGSDKITKLPPIVTTHNISNNDKRNKECDQVLLASSVEVLKYGRYMLNLDEDYSSEISTLASSNESNQNLTPQAAEQQASSNFARPNRTKSSLIRHPSYPNLAVEVSDSEGWSTDMTNSAEEIFLGLAEEDTSSQQHSSVSSLSNKNSMKKEGSLIRNQSYLNLALGTISDSDKGWSTDVSNCSEESSSFFNNNLLI